MDEALEVGFAIVAPDRFAIQRELHDIGPLHEPRAPRARQKIAIGVFRVTHAHVPEDIDDALIAENVICGYEFVQDIFGRSLHVDDLSVRARFSLMAGAIVDDVS
jgi:hypothetical protein